ncbi:Leucine-rich repeat protein [Handroanthus impetiginosus]|uniref:Leucine-rich repeat protein n=1 Tax=Handroanthus impetiginosus TaxID=429701 RepID=A0A2G9GME0_9LAMI|nr:Leucine-rich repeat protein [Handroanthus impetiginosus]
MIYYKGLTVILLLLFLFVLVSHCHEYDSVFASGELRCKAKEREALLRFKKGLIDEQDILSSWGSEEDKKECCKWKGIKCSKKTGHIVGLDLHSDFSNTSFRGNISHELLELSYLNHLDLSHNDFGNEEIPKFVGSLQRLQYLNLRDSKFYGIVPHQLGTLTNLRTLDLGFNNLVLKNFSWLSHLSSLSILDLSNFYLQDANLFQYIVKLPSMTDLHLSHCQIPTYFFVNSSSRTLSYIDLSYSGLTSSPFNWLFNMSTNLRSIDLSGNQLTNESLKILKLDSNMLSGFFPENFGQFSKLEHLDLSLNQITGSLPDLSAFVSLKELLLSHNKLQTLFARPWHLPTLEILDVASNSLEGTISEAINSLDFGPWRLQYLNLKDSSFREVFPYQLGKLTNLRTLDLGLNNLNSFSLSLSLSLSLSSLFDSNFAGVVPHQLGNLTNLKTLDLGFNNLVLKNLNFFSHFSSLSLLGLGGFDFRYTNILEDIFKLPSLIELHLSECHIPTYFFVNFSSTTPSILGLSYTNLTSSSFHWLLNMSTNLRSMDLSGNYFSVIPDAFERFTLLEYINLSYNRLSGGIPKFFGNLRHLQTLILSRNSLSEPLSELFCKLSMGANESLEVLVLYKNQFNGPFLDNFGQFFRLEHLDLFTTRKCGISDGQIRL